MTADRHHIWKHAAVAAAAMVCLPTVLATIAWYVDSSYRDPDMSGVQDLIFLFVMVLTVPALALSFGVLAPLTIVLDRLTRGRAPRVVNLLLGAVLGLPALAAFLIGGAFLQAGPSLHKLGDAMTRPLALGIASPRRGVMLLASFAVLGIIVALGMRHREDAGS